MIRATSAGSTGCRRLGASPVAEQGASAPQDAAGSRRARRRSAPRGQKTISRAIAGIIGAGSARSSADGASRPIRVPRVAPVGGLERAGGEPLALGRVGEQLASARRERLRVARAARAAPRPARRSRGSRRRRSAPAAARRRAPCRGRRTARCCGTEARPRRRGACSAGISASVTKRSTKRTRPGRPRGQLAQRLHRHPRHARRSRARPPPMLARTPRSSTSVPL